MPTLRQAKSVTEVVISRNIVCSGDDRKNSDDPTYMPTAIALMYPIKVIHRRIR